MPPPLVTQGLGPECGSSRGFGLCSLATSAPCTSESALPPCHSSTEQGLSGLWMSPLPSLSTVATFCGGSWKVPSPSSVFYSHCEGSSPAPALLSLLRSPEAPFSDGRTLDPPAAPLALLTARPDVPSPLQTLCLERSSHTWPFIPTRSSLPDRGHLGL